MPPRMEIYFSRIVSYVASLLKDNSGKNKNKTLNSLVERVITSQQLVLRDIDSVLVTQSVGHYS